MRGTALYVLGIFSWALIAMLPLVTVAEKVLEVEERWWR